MRIDDSDIELVNRLRNNDQAAFREIYDRYWESLFAIALSRLSNPEMAKDCIHDIFVDLWSRRNTAHIEKLGFYLCGAVKYGVYNCLAKQVREKKRMQQLQWLEESSKQSTRFQADYKVLDSEFAKREMEVVARLEVGFAELPDRCRQVFKMSREEKLSTREIAQRLNVSEKTVTNQMSRVNKKLRECILTRFKTGISMFVLAGLWLLVQRLL